MAGFRGASLKPQVQQTYMYLLKMSNAAELSQGRNLYCFAENF